MAIPSSPAPLIYDLGLLAYHSNEAKKLYFGTHGIEKTAAMIAQDIQFYNLSPLWPPPTYWESLLWYSNPMAWVRSITNQTSFLHKTTKEHLAQLELRPLMQHIIGCVDALNRIFGCLGKFICLAPAKRSQLEVIQNDLTQLAQSLETLSLSPAAPLERLADDIIKSMLKHLYWINTLQQDLIVTTDWCQNKIDLISLHSADLAQQLADLRTYHGSIISSIMFHLCASSWDNPLNVLLLPIKIYQACRNIYPLYVAKLTQMVSTASIMSIQTSMFANRLTQFVRFFKSNTNTWIIPEQMCLNLQQVSAALEQLGYDLLHFTQS